MKSNLESKLAQVAEETFASMAFLLPPEEEEPVEDDGSCRASASIDFSGPFRGSLLLSVSRSMLPILTGNILGSEQGGATSPEEQQDALKEVLNVICGNLLPLIATREDVFHVHQPRLVSNDDVAAFSARGATEATARLQLACGRVELLLGIDRPVEVGQARK